MRHSVRNKFCLILFTVSSVQKSLIICNNSLFTVHYMVVYGGIVVMSEHGTLGRIRANFTRDARYFQFHIFGEF